MLSESEDEFMAPNATVRGGATAEARLPLGTSSQAAVQATQDLDTAASTTANKKRGCRQPQETVDRVHTLVLEGRSLCGIRNILNQEGFKNSKGAVWPINNDHAVVKRIIEKKGYVVPPVQNELDEEEKNDEEDDEKDDDGDVTEAPEAGVADGADAEDADEDADAEVDGEAAEDGPRGRRRRRSVAAPVYNERQLGKPTQAATTAKTVKAAKCDDAKKQARLPTSRSATQAPASKRARGASALAEESNLEAFKLLHDDGSKSLLDPSLSYGALCDEACKALHPGKPPAQRPRVQRFTFKDHDGDTINIMNDMQLKSAVSAFKHDPARYMQLKADTSVPATIIQELDGDGDDD